MSKLRRYNLSNHPVFVTSVTHNRASILLDNSKLFVDALNVTRSKYGFRVIAWVLLPDHYHMILEPGENILSKIIGSMKLSFSSRYRKEHKLKSGRVWQLRYWDHVIRDQEDLNRHIDYIHYNPVKHGMVASPFNYNLSTAKEFMSRGAYSRDWGLVSPEMPSTDVGE